MQRDTITRLWLIRHGPTHAKGMTGWTDLPADLSDHTRIARLRTALPRHFRLLSSDLIRTRATARVLAPNAPLWKMPGLREINFGAWEGRTAAQIEATDADLARRYWSDPGDHAPKGGESWNGFSARIHRVTDQICTACPGEDLVCVLHFGVIVAMLARALDAPAARAFGCVIDPLSLTCIDRIGPHWRIGTVNRGF